MIGVTRADLNVTLNGNCRSEIKIDISLKSALLFAQFNLETILFRLGLNVIQTHGCMTATSETFDVIKMALETYPAAYPNYFKLIL